MNCKKLLYGPNDTRHVNISAVVKAVHDGDFGTAKLIGGYLLVEAFSLDTLVGLRNLLRAYALPDVQPA